MTNNDIAKLLRNMEAAYLILNENRFKVIAYQRAAEAVEAESRDMTELWKSERLDEVIGLGPAIRTHLDELFSTGHAQHFDTVLKKIPPAVFSLLTVSGIGPKRAMTLVSTLGLDNPDTAVADLAKAASDGRIAQLPGFGEQSERAIAGNTALVLEGARKEKRVLLSFATEVAEELVAYLKREAPVVRIDVLGSLRRQLPTIGDIDLAVVTADPETVIDRFVDYPKEKLIERGPTGASILLKNGMHVDLRIADGRSYGAMLQYFTGSKNHNVTLRSYALSKGVSLSEYGIKPVNGKKLPNNDHAEWNEEKKLYEFADEDKFYSFIGLPHIPPELREDRGEISAARTNKLPKLVELSDIRGDLHMHTSYDLESSHDVGTATLTEMLDHAESLGYAYIGISDHNPSTGRHTDTETADIMRRRQEYYRKAWTAWAQKRRNPLHLFVMLEVDITPDGTLALPDAAFPFVDAVVVSVHSSFAMDRTAMTDRVIRALEANPKVRILGHPTGRLLTKREGYELDWERLFPVLKQRRIALEINASPYRLDVSDQIVMEAKHQKIGCVIDSDAHSLPDMDVMRYGVAVARRGWAEAGDIVNTLPKTGMVQWVQGETAP
jgi:DNA polymerase (family 10)